MNNDKMFSNPEREFNSQFNEKKDESNLKEICVIPLNSANNIIKKGEFKNQFVEKSEVNDIFEQYSEEVSTIKNKHTIGDSIVMKRPFLQNKPKSKNKKNIPHTITSQDIEMHDTIGNNEINTKTYNYEIKSLTKSDNSLGSSEKYGKITKNDNIVQVLSIDSEKKQYTNTEEEGLNEYRISVEHNNDDSNAAIANEIENEFSSQIRTREKIHNIPVNKNKDNLLSLGKETNEFYDQEDDDKPGLIICRNNKYCNESVYEPQSIDNFNYNSNVKNKKSASAHIRSTEECKKVLNPAIKPVTDEKKPIDKSERRTHKRKKLFTSSCSEKIARKSDGFKQFNNPHNESPIDHTKPSLNSHHEISSLGIKNANDIFDSSLNVNYKDLYTYMEDMLKTSAPKKLFDQPFPTRSNPFKVGHKLEGIDPQHQALFCVMTVNIVCGFRIKLHFDGYPDVYDFWVNADCLDLFYPRWCEQNSRTVQPPNNCKNVFDWVTYVSLDWIPAPHVLDFTSTHNFFNGQEHNFLIGNKLEALDKLTRTLPKQLICVATVADVLGSRIRIHFDGWTDDYDYWTDITSTNLHPINWCENNGHMLSPPRGYDDLKGKKPFKWSEYLKETKSEPVPENAFTPRPPREFSIGMTIEVVDLVVPSLIRIAKIIEVRGDELKIVYDGFDIIYAYWVENDSPDIHPVGWCLRSLHPIEIPEARDHLLIIPRSCKLCGCRGKGNANNLETNHISAIDCPYKLDLWKNAVTRVVKLPDRLKMNSNLHTTTVSRSNEQRIVKNTDSKNNADFKNQLDDIHFKSNQPQNTSSISTSTFSNQPTTKIASQFKTNVTEINNNNRFSNPEREFNNKVKNSINESNMEEVHKISDESANSMIKKGEFKNQTVVKTQWQNIQFIKPPLKTIQNNRTKKLCDFKNQHDDTNFQSNRPQNTSSISTSTFSNQPTTKIASQSKTNVTEINNNNRFSNPEREFNNQVKNYINDSNVEEVHKISNESANSMIKKGEFKNQTVVKTQWQNIQFIKPPLKTIQNNRTKKLCDFKNQHDDTNFQSNRPQNTSSISTSTFSNQPTTKIASQSRKNATEMNNDKRLSNSEREFNNQVMNSINESNVEEVHKISDESANSTIKKGEFKNQTVVKTQWQNIQFIKPPLKTIQNNRTKKLCDFKNQHDDTNFQSNGPQNTSSISTSTFSNQPTTKIASQSKKNATEMNNDKRFSNPEREFNNQVINSINESNVEKVHKISDESANSTIKKGEFKNQTVVKTQWQNIQFIKPPLKTIQNNRTKKLCDFKNQHDDTNFQSNRPQNTSFISTSSFSNQPTTKIASQSKTNATGMNNDKKYSNSEREFNNQVKKSINESNVEEVHKISDKGANYMIKKRELKNPTIVKTQRQKIQFTPLPSKTIQNNSTKKVSDIKNQLHVINSKSNQLQNKSSISMSTVTVQQSTKITLQFKANVTEMNNDKRYSIPEREFNSQVKKQKVESNVEVRMISDKGANYMIKKEFKNQTVVNTQWQKIQFTPLPSKTIQNNSTKNVSNFKNQYDNIYFQSNRPQNTSSISTSSFSNLPTTKITSQSKTNVTVINNDNRFSNPEREFYSQVKKKKVVSNLEEVRMISDKGANYFIKKEFKNQTLVKTQWQKIECIPLQSTAIQSNRTNKMSDFKNQHDDI